MKSSRPTENWKMSWAGTMTRSEESPFRVSNHPRARGAVRAAGATDLLELLQPADSSNPAKLFACVFA
jgi:hypothetical protein